MQNNTDLFHFVTSRKDTQKSCAMYASAITKKKISRSERLQLTHITVMSWSSQLWRSGDWENWL